ncbi:MAG: winged helix-turn-helix transcriptional regulator [Dehalococcoidia bacterium]|nr:winged helix-turn-helix transcriptional regulator [Dehalococcoidia bacterium]MDH4299090.1 winged helix-turn-helix transcriptional regulator [Dehalococcoidia bacterium]MDH4366730.1 winged helix-turn-helix transcriptional regulator [Dehalococcoidia bacterium]
MADMAQILQSKNLATKFQIMVEIGAHQPNIQQKDIAPRLGITSQAVSEYIKELIKDGWLSSEGRSRYKVTKEGVDWILQMSRQLHSYAWSVSKVVADISTTTAIADSDLPVGQPASLYMKDGLLFASKSKKGKGAKGITVTAAEKGQDVAIRSIQGVIKLESAKVTIGKVPNVQDGGSKSTDLTRLKRQVEQARLTGALGAEALVALTQIGVKPDYIHGVREAVIEAAYCGLPSLVVCSEDKVPIMAQRLEEESLDYRIVDLKKR